MSHTVIHPTGWAPAKGYANGILTPEGTLYVGGQIGWTKDQIFKSHDFIGQMEQALSNIVEIVEAAGGRATDVVRLTWYVRDKKPYLTQQREAGEVYRRVFGRHFPAMSMLVVHDLVEDAALLEIEATAVILKRP